MPVPRPNDLSDPVEQSLTEALRVLRERKNWLDARIEAKKKVGWETQWDQREHDALELVISLNQS